MNWLKIVIIHTLITVLHPPGKVRDTKAQRHQGQTDTTTQREDRQKRKREIETTKANDEKRL